MTVGPSGNGLQTMSDENGQQGQTSFALVTQNLLAGLGGIALEQYLNSPPAHVLSELDDDSEQPPAPSVAGAELPGFPSMAQQESAQPSAETSKDTAGVSVEQSVTRLHQICQHAFAGQNDVLKFEFVQDEATRAWSCTLTIAHPNGSSKSYTSGTSHAKQSEAKARTCALAIQNGAIDFIVAANAEGHSAKATSATTTQQNTHSAAAEPTVSGDAVQQIEQYCAESGDARPKLDWIPVCEPKFGRTQGYALRVRHSAHVHKVYSVDTIYESPTEAQKACAEVALAEDVLDYIKHGRSQANAAAASTDESTAPESTETWTVQRFYEDLPQPVPETVPGKTAADINSPAWLNMAIQSARGAKIASNFIWTANAQTGLHGCLLRLTRPGESRSYLADAIFAKRNEAKAAVCLLAMSQGVGTWIRDLAKEVENRLSPEVKKQVTDMLLPALLSEYRKVRPSASPAFDFHTVQDACGCTLTVELSPTPSSEQTRRYTVEAEYRNRNDAKIAVVWSAVQQGVMEFILFRGQSLPSGYVPSYNGGDATAMNPRKRRQDWAGGDKPYGMHQNNAQGWDGQFKKPRLNGGVEGNFMNHPRGSFGRGRARGWNNRGTGRYRNDAAWMGPRMPGPGEVGYAAGPPFMGPPAGQFQPGPGVPAYGFVQHVTPSFIPPQNGAYPHNYGGYAPAPAAPGPTLYQSTPMPAANGAQYYGGVAQPGAAYPSYYPNVTSPSPGQYAQQAQNMPAANPYAAYSQSQASAPQSYTSTVSQAPVYYPPAHTHYSHPHTQPVYNPATGQYYPVPPAPYAQAPVSISQASPSPTPPATATVTNSTPQTSGTQTSTMVTPVVPTTVSPAVPTAPAAPAVPITAAPVAPQNPPAPSAQPQPIPIPISNENSVLVNRARSTPKSSGTRTPTGAGRIAVSVESAPKSSVTALYDHCRISGMPTPQFCHEIVKEQAEMKHKVWVVIGKQKLELPVTFSSLSQGQERVAKRVLEQLRSQAQAEPAKDDKLNTTTI
ncbi:hypothetical protein OBBRIDRAFT_798230 [Obba rivulosa]|uniref:Uncharacterized protein n=1 Tax=Obba rivulosa TaxID=1052685 RepID=A0A8E2ANB5_9APHY|nr:hypothetical protein OBBRIDRAFT_798230 [Obba rivulosa]